MLYVKFANQSGDSEFSLKDHPLLSTLFNDAPDAIFILNAKNYSILECNEKALELFEAESKSSLISLPSFRLYDSEPVEFSRNLLETNIKNGGEHSQELAFRTLKQNVFWGKLLKRAIKLEERKYIVLRISKAIDYLRSEEALSLLLRGTAKVTGTKFFKELSRLLCKTFDVKYALVGKISLETKSLKILESCGSLNGNVLNEIKLKESVIENVLKGYTTFYPNGVKDMFPVDHFVQNYEIEAFMGTPVFGNSGEVEGLIAFMHDIPITEIPNSRYILSIFASRTAAELQRIRSKEILKDQARSLANANALKDKLLSVISHDLFNPLHSVMGFSELLKSNIKEYSKERIINRVEIIDNSIKNIYFLLENLADWSRIYRGTVRPFPEKVDISEITEDNLILFQYISHLKELNIKVSLDKCPTVVTDKHMISSIIRNLLSNAIKYTPKKGSIEIGYNDNRDSITISITDTGIGMPEEELEAIDNVDTELPDFKIENHKPSGLGLVLAKTYTEKLKGKLIIQSKIDSGTEVLVNIPKE
ncbi:MAG: PAS domain-containing sensor histidine kinase [Bacteroidales bacterium]|nr:PAS domain-containing sensor histidine kinase [Bacteroidales bacterium]